MSTWCLLKRAHEQVVYQLLEEVQLAKANSRPQKLMLCRARCCRPLLERSLWDSRALSEMCLTRRTQRVMAFFQSKLLALSLRANISRLFSQAS